MLIEREFLFPSGLLLVSSPRRAKKGRFYSDLHFLSSQVYPVTLQRKKLFT